MPFWLTLPAVALVSFIAGVHWRFFPITAGLALGLTLGLVAKLRGERVA